MTFGGVQATGVTVSAGQVSCVFPARAVAGEVAVEVALNGQQYTSNSIQFRYYPPPVLSALSPAFGPIRGGTVVTLTGSGFFEPSVNPALYVRVRLSNGLDSQTVSATVEDSNTVSFTTDSTEAGTGELSITALSLNGQDYTEAPVSFFMYDVPSLTVTVPQSGPTTGGTTIQILGSFYDTGVVDVTFDGAPLSCAYASDTELTCVVPPRADGVALLSVQIDDLADTPGPADASNTLPFNYYVDPVIEELDPPLGPETGGTVVSVFGTGFVSTGDIPSCRFDGNVVTGTYRSTLGGHVSCNAPAGSAGDVSLEVALNGQDYVASIIDYTYYIPPVIDTSVPSSGPLRGDTLVTVYGTGFFNASQVCLCVWRACLRVCLYLCLCVSCVHVCSYLLNNNFACAFSFNSKLFTAY